MLSGIQHYRFCPRQWALIYLEQQWEENVLTMEGRILHQHVDDPFYRRKSGNCICLRSVNIASHELGLYGLTDIVELYPAGENEEFISHPDYPGRWRPYPVEYKHGRPKPDQIDEVQLAAQAMCLEEMYGISINTGAFYYGAIKRRDEVTITPELRDIVRECAAGMHSLFASRTIPHADYRHCCARCSILNVCMPARKGVTAASYYLKKNLYEEAT